MFDFTTSSNGPNYTIDQTSAQFTPTDQLVNITQGPFPVAGPKLRNMNQYITASLTIKCARHYHDILHTALVQDLEFKAYLPLGNFTGTEYPLFTGYFAGMPVLSSMQGEICNLTATAYIEQVL
jgi:hypothetical protein